MRGSPPSGVVGAEVGRDAAPGADLGLARPLRGGMGPRAGRGGEAGPQARDSPPSTVPGAEFRPRLLTSRPAVWSPRAHAARPRAPRLPTADLGRRGRARGRGFGSGPRAAAATAPRE